MQEVEKTLFCYLRPGRAEHVATMHEISGLSSPFIYPTQGKGIDVATLIIDQALNIQYYSSSTQSLVASPTRPSPILCPRRSGWSGYIELEAIVPIRLLYPRYVPICRAILLESVSSRGWEIANCTGRDLVWREDADKFQVCFLLATMSGAISVQEEVF